MSIFLQNLLLWGDSSSSVTGAIKTNICWYSPLAKYLSISYVLYCLWVMFKGYVAFKVISKLVCWKSFVINIVSFPTHVKVNHFCLVLLPQLSWSTFFFRSFSVHSLTLMIGNRLLCTIFWMIRHLFQKYVAHFLISKLQLRLIGKYWLLSKYVSFCDKVSYPQFWDGKLGNTSQLIFGKVWYVAIFRNPTPSIYNDSH